MEKALKNNLPVVAVRGGGDLATGVIQKLWRAGFAVLILETPVPLAIRRTVALCTAVKESTYTVEDVTAVRVNTANECSGVWASGRVPLLVDPKADCLPQLQPGILVDAIIAKRNIGTNRQMAPLTIGLGPGFCARQDVDVVVETMRGHNLGRLILEGSALANTGIPGELGGKSAERVVHAPFGGIVRHKHTIGDVVNKEDILFYIDENPVFSPLTGTLRGLIAEGISIPKGLKCADVDPRPAKDVDCYSISDKARCLGGAVLEACLWLGRIKNIL